MNFINGNNLSSGSNTENKPPTQEQIGKFIKCYNGTKDRTKNNLIICAERCGFNYNMLGNPKSIDEGRGYEWKLEFGILSFRNNLLEFRK